VRGAEPLPSPPHSEYQMERGSEKGGSSHGEASHRTAPTAVPEWGRVSADSGAVVSRERKGRRVETPPREDVYEKPSVFIAFKRLTPSPKRAYHGGMASAGDMSHRNRESAAGQLGNPTQKAMTKTGRDCPA